MYLSDMQKKDIVSVTDGKNLGRIIDAEINEDGQIINFAVEKRRLFLRIFKNNPDVFISIKNIDRVGEDVILVKID